MRETSHLLQTLLAVVVVFQTMAPSMAANPFEAVVDVLHNTKRRIGMQKPHAGCDPCVEQVGAEIDWLEHHVETFGSVVPKQPDVWGEARLTKYRQDVEVELAKRLGEFGPTLQGSIRRSDQSFLAAALSLDFASSNAGAFDPTLSVEESAARESVAEAQAAAFAAERQATNAGLAAAAAKATAAAGLIGDPNAEGQRLIVRAPQTATSVNSPFTFETTQISIEPTLYNDQLSRYLKALNQLRRINDGDDTSDSPGYSLNLVRLPVSILPGKMTRNGYGAEVSLTVQPQITDDLLPTTMRSLIINDVANMHSLPVAQELFNDASNTKESINKFEASQARLNKWMGALDRWVSWLEQSSAQAKDARQLDDAIEFISGNRSYFENRLLQIAGLSLDISGRDGRLQGADFVLFSKMRVKCGGKEADITFGVTAEAIATWLDDLSAREHDYRSAQALTVSYAEGSVNLEQFAAASSDRRKCYGLKVRLADAVELSGAAGGFDSLPLRIETEASDDQAKCDLIEPCAFTNVIGNAKKKLTGAVADGMRKLAEKTYANVVSSAIDKVGDLANAVVRPADSGALATNARASRRPVPPSAYLPVVGYQQFLDLVRDTNRVLERRPASGDVSSYLDVRSYVIEETNAAYDLLLEPEYAQLWSAYATPVLAHAVTTRDFRVVNEYRARFFDGLGIRTRSTAVATLAWSILVDAALLNERLKEDMQRVAKEKGCVCLTGECLTFVGPEETLTPEAQAAFKEYVNCRWPVQVFALDPVAEDQNVADQFSRRRELQLALAVGVARGTVRAGVASRFARRLETDIETIALNRTAVGFSHGADTFGWRFYPRLQSPDTPGTLGAFWETLAGGPDRDADLRDRGLEPGIRECTAIVVMPSFIPHVTFESRGSWFSLTNPRRKAWSMQDTLKISRNYQAVRRSLNCACESSLYRPGDVAHLSSVVEQIERRLPLQSMRVPVPYENTLGGFEMFQSGVSDLAPELYGYYGAPGVRVGFTPIAQTQRTTSVTAEKTTVQETAVFGPITAAPTTTLFLVGSRFSVHETRVLAGGKEAKFELISREIMRVHVPADANIVKDKETKQEYVDIHVATPYGVTGHLLVKAIGADAEEEGAAVGVKLAQFEKKVEDFEKTLAQLGRDLPRITTTEPKLSLVAQPQADGYLRLSPAFGVDKVKATFGVYPSETGGSIEVAVFDTAKGQYVTPRLDSGATIEPVPRAPEGKPAAVGRDVYYDAATLARTIQAALRGNLTKEDFKDKKKSLVGVLFVNQPDSAGEASNVRVLGEMKIEIAYVDTPVLTAVPAVPAPPQPASTTLRLNTAGTRLRF